MSIVIVNSGTKMTVNNIHTFERFFDSCILLSPLYKEKQSQSLLTFERGLSLKLDDSIMFVDSLQLMSYNTLSMYFIVFNLFVDLFGR